MAPRPTAEQYGSIHHEDVSFEEVDLDDESFAQLDFWKTWEKETPEWLSRFDEADFRTFAAGDGGVMERIRIELRVAQAARELYEKTRAPEDRDMTGAECNIHRITSATGQAAEEFVEETIRRHHDPADPLRVSLRMGYRDLDSLEQWREYQTLSLRSLSETEMRDSHTARYGFAIVTAEAIEWVREQTGGGPMVEIGAGNGWLAREMNERGITVHPTDPNPLGSTGYHLGTTEHMPVEQFDGNQALDAHPDCNMMWSWPEMRAYVPEVMRRFQGKHLLYIGEYGDGCTGPQEDLVVTTEGRYRNAGRYGLRSFPGVNDNIHLLERIDYNLQPAGRDPGEYPLPWEEHIRAGDLDDILQGTNQQDLAERIALAALEENRLKQDWEEDPRESLRRNLEFSIPHIARCTVSDAMRYGRAELRDRLEDRLLEQDLDEEEWAGRRVRELAGLALENTEALIRQTMLERTGKEPRNSPEHDQAR